MSLDIGINFRQTSGFVTDGTNETYDLGAGYPQTRGGATFGWVASGTNARDRNSGNDRRLAGLGFPNTIGDYWRLDLPSAGNYDVHFAGGDASGSQTVNYTIKDTTTTLFSVSPSTSGSQKFLDATSVERTNVTWPTGEVAKTSQTFATTQLRVYANSTTDCICHVRVVTAAVAAATKSPAMLGAA